MKNLAKRAMVQTAFMTSVMAVHTNEEFGVKERNDASTILDVMINKLTDGQLRYIEYIELEDSDSVGEGRDQGYDITCRLINEYAGLSVREYNDAYDVIAEQFDYHCMLADTILYLRGEHKQIH